MTLIPVGFVEEKMKIRPNGDVYEVVTRPFHSSGRVTLRLAAPDAKDISTDVSLTLPVTALVELVF